MTDTEVHRGESFVFDTTFSQFKNFEFYAEDSIVLNEGFSRMSVGSDSYMLPAYSTRNWRLMSLECIHPMMGNITVQTKVTKV